MRTGYVRVINNQDLYPIDYDMSSVVLNDRAQKAWTSAEKGDVRALLWSTLKASRGSLAFCIFPRVCLIGFRYAQPFLLSIGWGLTAAFGLVFLGLAVASGSYYHMTYRFVTSIRGILVNMIYTKTLDLSITALDESAAVTLMANDTGM
jgi:ATP-binding cassette subfamily C (CFTR/MRP) protein 1